MSEKFRLDIWHSSEPDPERPTYRIERDPDEKLTFTARSLEAGENCADDLMAGRPGEQGALLYWLAPDGERCFGSVEGGQAR